MRLFDIGTRADGQEVVHDDVLTVPNLITAVRLLTLPVFVWLVLGAGNLIAAYFTLGAIAGTDWIDGYVARRFDQVSRIGKLLDPLIDRVLLATAAVTLVVAGLVPLWLVVAILGRDVLVVLGALALFRGVPDIPVNRTGKVATSCLYFGLPNFMLAAVDWAGAALFGWLAWGFSLVGLGTYYIAGGQYALAVARRVGDRTTGRRYHGPG